MGIYFRPTSGPFEDPPKRPPRQPIPTYAIPWSPQRQPPAAALPKATSSMTVPAAEVAQVQQVASVASPSLTTLKATPTRTARNFAQRQALLDSIGLGLSRRSFATPQEEACIEPLSCCYTMISNGDTDLQRLMARAEPTVPLMPMVAPVAGHWWGPLDGPQPAGSTEADVLRAQLQVVRREIVAKERQLAMLPGGRQEEDGFIRCVGKTCFKGDGGQPDMKLTDVTELTECKERCRGDECGAFVVTGDVCRFCPKKVSECRQNLVDDPMSITYLNSSTEAAQLCGAARRLVQSCHQLRTSTSMPRPQQYLEAELRRKTAQSMELHRSVQALEEALQSQMEASDHRVEEILTALRAALPSQSSGHFKWPEADARPPRSSKLLADRKALLRSIGLAGANSKVTHKERKNSDIVQATVLAHGLEASSGESPFPMVQGSVVNDEASIQKEESPDTHWPEGGFSSQVSAESAQFPSGLLQDTESPFPSEAGKKAPTGWPEALQESSSGGMQWPGTAQAGSPGFPPSPGFPEASPAKEGKQTQASSMQWPNSLQATKESPAVSSGFPPSPGFPEASPAKDSKDPLFEHFLVCVFDDG
eukprot:symbB.v1.2.037834.t1/scaffold5700.1/size24414/2